MEKYIIGIDFGFNTTEAWIIPILDNSQKKDDGCALTITPSHESGSIPSVVYFDSNENHSLVPIGKYGIATEMKGLISSLSAETKIHYAKYIKLIIERILEQNKDKLNIIDGIANFKLGIACPTEWNDSQQKEYLNFFNEAIAELNLRFDWIISEGYAAYHSVMDRSISGDYCSLIIDYASRAIHYIAIKNGLKISDNTWTNNQIGANIIEHMMFSTLQVPTGSSKDKMLNETKDLLLKKGFNNIDPIKALMQCLCKEKEACYTNQCYDIDVLFRFYKVTGDSDFAYPVYEFVGNLNDITKDYRDIVRRELKYKRELLLAVNGGREPDRIILCGGASDMIWFLEMVREVFSCEVYDDIQRNHTIAKGIATFGLLKERSL
jgi:hypothetical protein